MRERQSVGIWELNIDVDLLFDETYIEDEKVSAKVQKTLGDLKSYINRMKHNLKHQQMDLFRETKDITIRFLDPVVKKLLNSDIREADKRAIEHIFTAINLALRSCSPPKKIESEIERKKNIEQEGVLLSHQSEFNKKLVDKKKKSKLLETFAQIKTELRSARTVYLVHVLPTPMNEEREKEFISQFIPNLVAHLKLAGVDIKLKDDSFAGANSLQFVEQLTNRDYILVLGTESLRKRFLEEPKTDQFRGKLKAAEYELARSEGHTYSPNEPLVKRLMPYVLTGIKETSFPDEWEFTTIYQLQSFESNVMTMYESVLTEILCRVYEISLEVLSKRLMNMTDESLMFLGNDEVSLSQNSEREKLSELEVELSETCVEGGSDFEYETAIRKGF